MEKICLNSSPSSLLSAKIGSVFELDGRDYILEGNHLVYLTLLDDLLVSGIERRKISMYGHISEIKLEQL